MPLPTSLVAEKAVRLLRKQDGAMPSLELAERVLATRGASEGAATAILRTAFSGDRRLIYGDKGWDLDESIRQAAVEEQAKEQPAEEPDRTLIYIHGERRPGEPFSLHSLSVLRLQGEEVLSACGGDTVGGPYGNRLRRAILESLDGAVPVIHDPPGSLKALEAWLGESVALPISLRRLAQQRVGLPAGHSLEDLVARLGLHWRETDDPLELADVLDACLQALRRPDENLQALRGSGVRPIDWARYAFNREFLRRIPNVAGTYRFYDAQGKLVYVGKSKNLNRRVGSYFREEVRGRSKRVQKLIDSVYRIEYEAVGSDLEAMLREAELIRTENPERNVQRKIHVRGSRATRLRSILILEPAQPPTALRAYLIRSGRLLDRVDIGPRGGGLKRIRRLLEDQFFSVASGPTLTSEGPDLDVEVVVRWLAANRDRVVAFDPTDLGCADEVVERLQWFLSQGSTFDPDGFPILTR